MAEIPVNVDLDFVGNQIKNATTPDVLLINQTDLDIPNRKYVNDKVKMDTTNATTKTTTVDVGNIPAGSNIANLEVKSLLDQVFFGAGDVTYVVPSFVVTTNLSGDTLLHLVGNVVNATITVNATLNDSANIVSYYISGPGITGTLTFATTSLSHTFTLTALVLEENMTWTVGVNYAASPIKQDALGNDVPTGMFAAGNVEDDLQIASSLAIMYSLDYNNAVDISNPAIPSSTVFSTLESKVFRENVMDFPKLYIGKNKAFAINIAMPGEVYLETATRNATEDLSQAFSRRVVTDMPDYTSSGVTHKYTIFSLVSTVGYNTLSEFDFEFNDRIKYGDDFTDLIYYRTANQVEINNSGILSTSYNVGTSSPVFSVNNKFAAYYDAGAGLLRLFSQTDTIVDVIVSNMNDKTFNVNLQNPTISLAALTQYGALPNTVKFRIRHFLP